MDLPSKHVLDLSKRIGARGAGSDGETAAASYILRVMSEFDADIEVETFSSWKSDLHALIMLYLAAAVAYAAFQLSFAVSIAISATVFLVFQMEVYSWGVASKLLPRSKASNVIASVAPTGVPRRTVVLTANYDSARSSPLGGRRLARAYRLLIILSFVSITAIGLLAIFGQGASLLKISTNSIFLTWLICAPFPAFLLVLSAAMIWGEIRGRYTAGANDNASGVGVLLSVTGAVAAKPLENTTVWGVATGRGAAGGRGMVSLLKRHRRDLKHAFIINLDHLGRGSTRIVTREGAMLGFHSSRRLTRLAFKAAGRSEGLNIARGKCRVKKSDAMVATVRGYSAVTIGGTSGGSYDGFKDADDTYEKIQRASLDRSARFVRLLLEEIDDLARRSKKARASTEATDDSETVEEGEEGD